MAPVDPNTTWRLRVHYNGRFGAHTMLFHDQLSGGSIENLEGDARDFLEQCNELVWHGTTFGSAEFATPGQAFFNPVVDWEPIIVSNFHTDSTGFAPSGFIQFGGRSISTGVRVKLYLFETAIGPNTIMRLNAGANADVDAAIGELNSADNQISSVDGQLVIWKTYVNIGQNDHLTHKART